MRVWVNARDLAQAAASERMPVPAADLALLSRRGLGLRLIREGARYVRTDPVLARATLAAGIGQLLSNAAFGLIHPMPERTAVPPAP
jgi:hypothetical protein